MSKGAASGTAFLSGDGELARLIAAFDWSQTPVGSIASWPDPMKTVIGFILRSDTPIVTLWGERGVMIYNDAYRGFAGGRHPGLLGTNVLEGWHEVAEFNANVLDKVYHGGGTLSFADQELMLERDGTLRQLWANLEYSPVLGDDGQPLGVVAIVLETTERVLATRAVADERRRLLQMAENAPSFMALLEGPEHRFTMTNPQYQSLIGGRDVLGKTVAEALPEAAAQGYLDLLNSVFASGEPLSLTGVKYDVQTEPGGPISERYVDFVYQPITDSGGQVTGIFVDGFDVTDRMHAQAALDAASAQFRVFAQTMPNHIWTAPPNGQLDWFNDQVFAYSGRTEAQLAGDGWADIVHPDDLASAAELWAEALKIGETYETEFRLRRADGAFRWHLVRAVPIRDEDGHVIRWVGTNTDIQEQKLSQEESIADRDRIWTMAQDLMLICTDTGIITAVNPSVERALGWSEDQMTGRSVAVFVHPDDVAGTKEAIAKLAGGARTVAFENRYRTLDGSYRILAWTAVPEAGRLHCIARDVTEERQVERDRDRIWNLSPVLKVVASGEGAITDVNPRWTQILDWSREETLGKRTTDFMIDDEEAWKERVRALATGKPLLDYRTQVRAKDGSTRNIQWMTFPENGKFYGFGRDITSEVEAAAQLAETEAALRQSQKMEAVGQLTGGIAHDFNNLLQGISGSLEIIQRRVAQGRHADIDRFVVGASTAAKRAAALTHRLLAFSRRQPLDPKPTQANRMVASMEDLFRRTIGERIDLELVLAAGLWTTLCDPNQLESALLNLVINARDAMPEGGQLTIETCNAHLDKAYAAKQRGVTPGQYVCICVTDTGVGMEPDIVAKVFEPFFTTKPIGQGTGLGLSMIYGFAQQSEGYAKIYSEPGKGTTFKLYLPRHRGQTEEEEDVPQITQAHMSDSSEVVLVIEDEAVVRGLIVDELTELGYRTIEADDGPSGLEILQSKKRIDLVITDIGLPGLNGRQVADAARLVRPQLKVLFMTGYAENAALASGFLEPGMQMITKPFPMEALATQIKSMLA